MVAVCWAGRGCFMDLPKQGGTSNYRRTQRHTHAAAARPSLELGSTGQAGRAFLVEQRRKKRVLGGGGGKSDFWFCFFFWGGMEVRPFVCRSTYAPIHPDTGNKKKKKASLGAREAQEPAVPMGASTKQETLF